jgi:hypothetical protein
MKDATDYIISAFADTKCESEAFSYGDGMNKYPIACDITKLANHGLHATQIDNYHIEVRVTLQLLWARFLEGKRRNGYKGYIVNENAI